MFVIIPTLGAAVSMPAFADVVCPAIVLAEGRLPPPAATAACWALCASRLRMSRSKSRATAWILLFLPVLISLPLPPLTSAAATPPRSIMDE